MAVKELLGQNMTAIEELEKRKNSHDFQTNHLDGTSGAVLMCTDVVV